MNFKVCRLAPIIVLLLCLGCAATNATTSEPTLSLLRGRLQVMIADDFKNQTATTHYRLMREKDGTMLRLLFLHGTPKPALRSGTRVEVRGYLDQGLVKVESLRVLGDR